MKVVELIEKLQEALKSNDHPDSTMIAYIPEDDFFVKPVESVEVEDNTVVIR